MAYREAAYHTPIPYLQGAFSGRSAVLEDVMHDIHEVSDKLAGLPRLS